MRLSFFISKPPVLTVDSEMFTASKSGTSKLSSTVITSVIIMYIM